MTRTHAALTAMCTFWGCPPPSDWRERETVLGCEWRVL